MKCRICGEEFDPAHLALVFLHEHNEDINPSIAIGIKGKETTKTKNMKKCKGFDSFPCWICNRENKDVSETIVNSLVFDPDTTTAYCNYWIPLNHQNQEDED